MSTYHIRHGETRSGLVISSSDQLDVKHGGTAVAALIDGGSMYVAAGGQTLSSVIGSGFATIDGTASDTIIDYGTLTLDAGGVATDTSIVSTGLQLIAGGMASGTVIEAGGGETVRVGETDGAVVSSGGVELVLSGAMANGTIVSAGGILVVLPGGVDTSTMVKNGGVVLAAEGVVSLSEDGNKVYTAQSGTVAHGYVDGLEYVFSGGRTVDTAVYGTQIVEAGGAAISTSLNYFYGKQEVLSGGVASFTNLTPDTVQTVTSGGVADYTTVSGFSTLSVQGGSITSAKVGYSYNIYINSLTHGLVELDGGSATDTIISGGEITVDGGTAVGTILQYVNSPGRYVPSVENVISGGTTKGTVVKEEAILSVLRGVASNTEVASGGTLNVSRGGLAIGTKIDSTGHADFVNAKGAIDTTIESGGRLQLFDTPSNDTIIQAGGIIDLGALTFHAGGSATLDRGTDILTLHVGAVTSTLQLAGNYSSSAVFGLSSDGQFGTYIVLSAGVPALPTLLSSAAPVPAAQIHAQDVSYLQFVLPHQQ